MFLSGNGPLVEVLREALARDAHQRTGGKKSESERKVNAFIQNIHHFRDANFESVNAPFEHVAVFDEAQRAWNQHQVAKFMKRRRNINDFGKSEAHFLIEVMNRHHDWCVIVCLIGGGQEIHTGEAGITEWLKPMNEYFKEWEVHASPFISHYSYIENDTELSNFVNGDRVTKDESLHLSTSIRSFRAGTLSDFISKLLDGSSFEARKLIDTLKNYPIYATRDIRSAKEWLKSKSRGSRRSGIIASSGGARLKPDGVFVECVPDPKVWFLNGKNDVRSSYSLEIAATEFHVQGLELDWACVCWDADLRHTIGGWKFFNFKGSKWNQVRSKAEQKYLLNAYRVLLTRAREGLIVFVPKGSDADQTTQCDYYDGIWNYLLECGIKPID